MSIFEETANEVFELKQRLKALEEQLHDVTSSTTQVVQSIFKKDWNTDVQPEPIYGMQLALCVDTADPLGEGRVRFFMPHLHKRTLDVKQLPWAKQISIGAFDDAGLFSAPPAGSTIAILFKNGDREAPFYIGGIWNRDRGTTPHKWGFPVKEYDCIHEGNRDGYYVGANDGSQVLPPSNTENYNIKDPTDLSKVSQDPDALKKVVPSHMVILKSPQKHRIKMDDGNYMCHNKGMRLEIGSGGGHTFLMYDDHMNAAGQYGNPKSCTGEAATGGNGVSVDCGTQPCNKPEGGSDCGDHNDQTCKNELFKHASESRAIRGPGTPQNNRLQLQQSGVFLQSISGQTFVMDDEVSDPRGIPGWKKSTENFDFGCEDKFYGKMYMETATGNRFHMGDAEDEPNVRSGTFRHPKTGKYEPNGILLETATGISLELNNHTLSGGTAGENRFAKLQSSSGHVLELNDYTNEQKSEDRKGGGQPATEATRAFVKLKSGYGLQILMRDDSNQKTADKQFIEIMAPMIENNKGPHILRMQEAPNNDPGVVLLRVGGYMFGTSTDEWIEQVGTKESPASKFTVVTQHEIRSTDEFYFHQSDLEFHFAKKYIILAAGEDCEGPDGPTPCLYPVIVGKKPWACPFTGQIHFGAESMSERVFASAKE